MSINGQAVVFQNQVVTSFDEGYNFGQNLIGVATIIADCDNTQHGRLPQVVIFDLGDGDIELPVNAIFERAEDHPFCFERVSPRDVKVNFERPDYHNHYMPMIS